MIKVIIDRAKWDRGFVNMSSRALLNNKGGKCCLGFVCNALGISDKEICEVEAPANLAEYNTNIYSTISSLICKVGKYTFSHNNFVSKVIKDNDDPYLSDPEREKLIAANLAACGFDVEFIGEGLWKP